MLLYVLSVLGLVPNFQKTKCKKLLSTTMKRIKLLERRRQALLRQLHGDVIELLKRGKDHSIQPCMVRIWKELCLFSVYKEIADYCQFVQENLEDIAAQRECPCGMEEPVAGLCFAASCCADLPELQELRDIFAMKYGKHFVKAAQELQPKFHVDQWFLECVCSKELSEAQKQALLEEITTRYNLKQGRVEHETQPYAETCDSSITQGFVDVDERDGHTLNFSEVVQDQSERGEMQEVDEVVQESNH